MQSIDGGESQEKENISFPVKLTLPLGPMTQVFDRIRKQAGLLTTEVVSSAEQQELHLEGMLTVPLEQFTQSFQISASKAIATDSKTEEQEETLSKTVDLTSEKGEPSMEDVIAIASLKHALRQSNKEIDLNSTVTVSLGDLRGLFLQEKDEEIPAEVLEQIPPVVTEPIIAEEQPAPKEERKVSTAEKGPNTDAYKKSISTNPRKEEVYTPPKEMENKKVVQEVMEEEPELLPQGETALEKLKEVLEKTDQDIDLGSTLTISIGDLRKFYQENKPGDDEPFPENKVVK